MNYHDYTKVWSLSAGELIQLDGARGTTLRVTRGTLWLTLEDDTRDVVLNAGDVFTIDRGGLTLVEAQDTTTVHVSAHHVSEWRVRDGRTSWTARILGWLESISDPLIDRRSMPYY